MVQQPRAASAGCSNPKKKKRTRFSISEQYIRYVKAVLAALATEATGLAEICSVLNLPSADCSVNFPSIDSFTDAISAYLGFQSSNSSVTSAATISGNPIIAITSVLD
ncbi:hypothetical protein CEUSTIGMA_g12927.t1 [Chlamydomonas eustigma]|uniref:Uncharacterized protein n=1 Tax=Chlamydomonas eustigma TaxID=1157962 RepID=A0A250XR07_9CHLO|nr:hypothetical protein CEUSTIGMA_g12927.t1 [Chlamydomonas eustigma]|eukprot:GAX85511.1 hypothetical protein CEUSTIGMA_g12927.t1 [Chlamydomonas eustigma]